MVDLFDTWYSASQLTKLRPSLLLTLVRHGQSEGNKRGLIQGQSDYPLSELGTQQARALRAYLDDRDITFDAVYSSDLSRARQTADIVAADLDIIEDRRLRTRRYGEFSRLVPCDTDHSGLRAIPLGGETSQQVRQRAAEFLRDACDRHLSPGCSRLLVVTHNWLICQLANHLAEVAGRPAEAWDEHKTPNTGFTVLHVAQVEDGTMAATFLKIGGDEHLERLAEMAPQFATACAY